MILSHISFSRTLKTTNSKLPRWRKKFINCNAYAILLLVTTKVNFIKVKILNFSRYYKVFTNDLKSKKDINFVGDNYSMYSSCLKSSLK